MSFRKDDTRLSFLPLNLLSFSLLFKLQKNVGYLGLYKFVLFGFLLVMVVDILETNMFANDTSHAIQNFVFVHVCLFHEM